MAVTVITPSLPERAGLLAECITSVAAQTFAPAAHLIGVDHTHDGPARVRNRLLAATDTEWVAFVDDDDLLDAHHLETLTSAPVADVIIPFCRFDGPPIPTRYVNQPYDRGALADHGIFPITVLARRQAILAAGCFDPVNRYEDWSLWNRMADNGATFTVVPTVTWTYRTAHAGRRTNAA